MPQVPLLALHMKTICRSSVRKATQGHMNSISHRNLLEGVCGSPWARYCRVPPGQGIGRFCARTEDVRGSIPLTPAPLQVSGPAGGRLFARR